MKKYTVGLVGVGAVGTEMIKVLKERNFPLNGKVQVFASRERDEQILGETYHVLKADENCFKGLDIVLFAGKTDVALQLKDACVKAGAKMIDNSRAFRQDPEVPLVVPQVNADDLDWNKGVIANPNCTPAIMLEAVAPLHKAKGLKRLIASTYQAASGAGAPGLDELEDQIHAYAKGEPLTVKAFQHQLMYNLIPHIDKFDETNWYTLEELKMRNEARKMLHHPDLKLSCTCVRVPIARAHSESLNLEFENDITPEEAREILKGLMRRRSTTSSRAASVRTFPAMTRRALRCLFRATSSCAALPSTRSRLPSTSSSAASSEGRDRIQIGPVPQYR